MGEAVVGVSPVIILTASTVFGEAECAVDAMRLRRTDIGARFSTFDPQATTLGGAEGTASKVADPWPAFYP